MKHAYYWQRKLTPFDGALCRMVEDLTGKPCKPKNGGDHYFIEVDYSDHRDPDYILAIWDAIEGRAGERLIRITDDHVRGVLVVLIKFHKGPCKEAEFVPKTYDEASK